MSKLTIMKGLPASGKTTKAKEIIKEAGNTVRINKDLLRTMLHFDKFTHRNEKLTQQASLALTLSFLTSNVNVIVDDTNLNLDVVAEYQKIAKTAKAKMEYFEMNVPLEALIIRDEMREKKVGFDVIINMAVRYGLHEIPGPIVICDLDGTLCDLNHRLHHVKGEKKDWKSFFKELHKDTPNPKVAEMLQTADREGKTVVFVSGRPEEYKEQTLKWLYKHHFNFFHTIIMRRSGDSRDDDIVKEDILNTYFPDKSKIELVIDDRPRVIRMWERNGLKVIDVGSGVEF